MHSFSCAIHLTSSMHLLFLRFLFSSWYSFDDCKATSTVMLKTASFLFLFNAFPLIASKSNFEPWPFHITHRVTTVGNGNWVDLIFLFIMQYFASSMCTSNCLDNCLLSVAPYFICVVIIILLYSVHSSPWHDIQFISTIGAYTLG